MPTRNAPTAADTSSCWVMPATSRVMPITARSRASSEGVSTRRVMWSPYRNASTRITPAMPSAAATDNAPVSTDAPASIDHCDRQVDRHHQVLDHEQGEDGRCLAVAETTEVGEHLGDHARRRDVRDPRRARRAASTPQPRTNAAATPGSELSTRSTDAAAPAAAGAVGELVGGVLEAEREEQEHHADLGRELDEVLDSSGPAMPPSPKTTPAMR